MKVYFNNSLNVCADRDNVIDAEMLNGRVDSRDEAANALDMLDKGEWHGWKACELLIDVEENVTLNISDVFRGWHECGPVQ